MRVVPPTNVLLPSRTNPTFGMAHSSPATNLILRLRDRLHDDPAGRLSKQDVFPSGWINEGRPSHATRIPQKGWGNLQAGLSPRENGG